MAGSVIDSLVVTLGLDSKAFASGIKGSTEQLAGFTSRLAGMFLAVRGLEDVVGYFKDLHHQLAEIGFTSRNLGVAGTELKKLGEVSELFGGQMQDAADSVENLQASVFNLRYRGQLSDSLMMLQRFGVAYLDAAGHARKFRDVALDAARAIDRQAKTAGLNQGERYQMALSFGFSGGVASAVAQGGKGLEDALNKAKVDQRALTEKTIQGQVKLDRSLTRLQEATAAQSSAILSQLTPVIGEAVKALRHLADEVLPKITHAIEAIQNFFRNPPTWFKSLEDHLKQLEHLLGPTGSLIAGIAGLSLALGAGGALVRILGTLVSALLLAPAKLGAGAIGGLAGLAGKLLPYAGVIAAGVGLGALLDKIPTGGGKNIGDAVESATSSVLDFFGVGSDAGKPNTGTARGIIARPPPTPTAPRPPSAAAQSAGAGAPPTAMNGGPSVQIDSMTVNTRATDADGIAGDMLGAIRRKLLVANADAGLA